MKRYCLALDLKEDPKLIADYETYHQSVWPEIIASIKEAGIVSLEIYRVSNRLFMIMEVNEDFSFEKKAQMDQSNSIVQHWGNLCGNTNKHYPLLSLEKNGC